MIGAPGRGARAVGIDGHEIAELSVGVSYDVGDGEGIALGAAGAQRGVAALNPAVIERPRHAGSVGPGVRVCDARQVRGDRRQQSIDALTAGGHESWELAVVDARDGGLGLTVGLVLCADVAWFWAVLCRADHRTVGVIDDAVPLPRGPNLEVRTSGLWAEIGIQTPGEHLTADLEAFGLKVDAADDLLGPARGERTAMGLDVEWHRTSAPVSLDGGHRIEARVEGEILLGTEAIELSTAASGAWVHRWGLGAWPGPTNIESSFGPVIATAATAVGEWAWRDRLVDGPGLGWVREVVRWPGSREG